MVNFILLDLGSIGVINLLWKNKCVKCGKLLWKNKCVKCGKLLCYFMSGISNVVTLFCCVCLQVRSAVELESCLQLRSSTSTSNTLSRNRVRWAAWAHFYSRPHTSVLNMCITQLSQVIFVGWDASLWGRPSLESAIWRSWRLLP